VNVAEAESYRDYWDEDWRPPEADDPGFPGFLIGADREGWTDNFPVRYWSVDWHGVLFGSESAVVDRILACGFDGLFLDWVAGWSDTVVGECAGEDGVDPAEEMARLLTALALHARSRSPGFLLLANNGAHLVEKVPALAEVLDGLVQESVLYSGRAAMEWEDPENADRRRSPASVDRIRDRLDRCRSLGLPVLTLDYASRPENLFACGAFAGSRGYVPCVSRTPLDRLPEHVGRR
jgi:cysteinyl-tRNA synthetase